MTTSELSKEGYSAAQRAREILGSMKIRRETFSDAVRKQGGTKVPVEGGAKPATTERVLAFNGETSETIALQMKMALQEKRERLARILAGLDPDEVPPPSSSVAAVTTSTQQSLTASAPLQEAAPEAESTTASSSSSIEEHSEHESGHETQSTESSTEPTSRDHSEVEVETVTESTEPSSPARSDDTEHQSPRNDLSSDSKPCFPSDTCKPTQTTKQKPPTLDEINEAFSYPARTYTTCDESSALTSLYYDQRLGESGQSFSYAHGFDEFSALTSVCEHSNDGETPHVEETARQSIFKRRDDQIEEATDESVTSSMEQRIDKVPEEQEGTDDMEETSHTASHGDEVSSPETPNRTPVHEDHTDSPFPDSLRDDIPDHHLTGMKRAYSFESCTLASVKEIPRRTIPMSFSFGCTSNTESRLTMDDFSYIPCRSRKSKAKAGEADMSGLNRPTSPFSETSSMCSDTDRPMYIGNLYSPSDKDSPHVSPTEKKSPLMGISLVTDKNLRRQLSRSFDDSSEHHGGQHGSTDSKKSSTITISLCDDRSRLDSDGDSYDFTLDSGTSGWISNSTLDRQQSISQLSLYDDLTEVSYIVPLKSELERCKEDEEEYSHVRPVKEITTTPTSILKNDLKSDSSKQSADFDKDSHKRVAFAQPKVNETTAARGYKTKQQQSIKKPPLLFVSEEVADALAKSTSGMYAIALKSGLDMEQEMEICVIPQKKPAARFVRLSTDFRCGAQGSMYDIAQRSGFDLSTPWSWRKSKKTAVPAKGGLWDIAFRSGLTKEVINSRTPFTVKIKPLSLCREDDATVLPEDVTDYECGTTGNLFLAFESAGGGGYETKGSLYYLASRSGMKVN